MYDEVVVCAFVTEIIYLGKKLYVGSRHVKVFLFALLCLSWPLWQPGSL